MPSEGGLGRVTCPASRVSSAQTDGSTRGSGSSAVVSAQDGSVVVCTPLLTTAPSVTTGRNPSGGSTLLGPVQNGIRTRDHVTYLESSLPSSGPETVNWWSLESKGVDILPDTFGPLKIQGRSRL